MQNIDMQKSKISESESSISSRTCLGHLVLLAMRNQYFLDTHYDRTPNDPCLTDLDRILGVEQDPGAHHYLVPGTVPIKEENPEVLGAHGR